MSAVFSGRLLCSCVLLGLGASLACGENEVQVDVHTFTGGVSTYYFNVDEDIQYRAPQIPPVHSLPLIATNVERINVYPANFDPASVPTLGRVILQGTGTTRTTALQVYLGSGAFPSPNASTLPAVAGDWRGIGVTLGSGISPAQVQFAGAINGNTRSAIEVGTICRLDVGGEIRRAVILSGDTGEPYLNRLFCQSLTSAGSITVANWVLDELRCTTSCSGSIQVGGNIRVVRAVNGSILSPQILSGASIGEIRASTGDIGTAVQQVVISTGQGGTLARVEARNVYAAIAAPGGTIGTITILTGNLVGSVAGRTIDRVTQLVTPAADGRVQVAGDLDADITLEEDIQASNYSTGGATIIVGGEFTAGRTILAGASLVSGPNLGGIQLTASGVLKGQVILNGNNATGTWSAPVSVGGVTLSATPTYDQTNASLGNGSVGLVRFQLHVPSSDEQNFEPDGLTPKLTWTQWSDVYTDCTRKDVLVELHGPVRRTTNAAVPPDSPLLKVMFDDSVPTQGGHTIAAADVTHFLDITVGTGIPGARQVRIRPKTATQLPWGNYTVSTWQDGRPPTLVCDSLPGTTEAGVADFSYTFTIGNDCDSGPTPLDCALDSDCPGMAFPAELCDSIDFNNDGVYPDSVDLSDFLSVFSGGVCSADPYCNDIDFNNDGLYPDTIDIMAFLSVFGGGPCLWNL